MRMRFLIAQRGYFLWGGLSDSQQCVCQRIRSDNFPSTLSWERKYKSTSAYSSVLDKGSSRNGVSLYPPLQHRKSSSNFRQGPTNLPAAVQNPDLTGKQIKELKKIKSDKSSTTVFYDSLRIFVKGGMGGHGLPKHGGVGGKGGDVVAIGHKDVTLKKVSQLNPERRFKAESGTSSKFFCLNGVPGKNLIVPVPLGVSIVTELGHKIGEINNHGEKLVVAKGGDGGRESNQFSPEVGQSHNVKLDLKLIADVGFVGFPNAGKSTLLKAASRASPRIASYPFTTVRPNVGVIEFADYRQISLADLPGLIEGAHENIGMGHKFLKHVERTKVLLFVIDIHGFQLGPQYPFRSALETIILLNKELELYKEELTEKPAVLALNKIDLPGSYKAVKDITDIVSDRRLYENYLRSMPTEIVPENVLMFDKIVPISAKTDAFSVDRLKKVIREVIDINASECNNNNQVAVV